MPARLADSLGRDVRLLGLPGIRMADRGRLLFEKYASQLRSALGMPLVSPFDFAGRPYHISTPTDAALLQRVLSDTYECLELFELTGQPGLIAVDVGAHNGETAIAWSIYLRDPVIYSFEPEPISFSNAVANIGKLVAAVHPMGLSDRAGEAPFETGRGSGGDATFALPGATPEEVTPVPVTRGDDILAGVSPDLVKIDVEGYELHVLEGLQATLSCSRFLTIEMSLQRPKDHRFHEVASVLAAHRFELIGTGRPHGTEGSRPTAVDLHFRRVMD